MTKRGRRFVAISGHTLSDLADKLNDLNTMVEVDPNPWSERTLMGQRVTSIVQVVGLGDGEIGALVELQVGLW